MTMEASRILVVDDEQEFCQITARLLEKEGLIPLQAYDGKTAVQKVRLESPEVVLADKVLPDVDGLDLLRQLKDLDQDLPVVLMTGQAGINGAVEAMRGAAHDYLQKPFQAQDLMRIVRRALAERQHNTRLRQLSRQTNPNHDLTDVMGASEAVGKLIVEINRVSRSNFTVVILGETGSGKEVVARAIHLASPRARNPFVPVDCGAIPETLLEGELFGHERGAFTGAVGPRRGKMEQAQGGTLFLDEILNLPVGSQAKLLRVLQERVVYHLGGSSPIPIDLRLLVAASEDLEASVAAGGFRQDLFYRLNEFVLRIPPLRERPEDIMYLAKRFLDSTDRELNKTVRGFSASAEQALVAYCWPGNVRQLRSTIRRAVLLADEEVREEHLGLGRPGDGILPAKAMGVKTPPNGTELPSLKELVERAVGDVEREALLEALRRTGGNKARAARLLHIDYKTLYLEAQEIWDPPERPDQP